ncbi:MAG: hypothetical protein F6K30_26500, partial [Cyanothece sp. SIO2G6]|nr:hypothetical protein [Cyanothece sp. SIO2G6]
PISVPQATFPIEVASEARGNQPHSDINVSQAASSEAAGAINFVRAIRNLLVTDVYVLESALSFTGSGSGFSLEFDLQVQTLIQQPNQFQSSIQFVGPDGAVNRQYVLTSDGQQVWIYDADQNVYSTISYSEFDANYSDSFLIGLFRLVLFDLSDELSENRGLLEILISLSEEVLQEQDVVSGIETSLDIANSTIGTEIVDGIPYTTFAYLDPQSAVTMTLFIDPITALIERIHVTRQSGGMTLVVEEDVIHKAPPVSLASDAFVFLPPDDAQLSDTLVRIRPF